MHQRHLGRLSKIAVSFLVTAAHCAAADRTVQDRLPEQPIDVKFDLLRSLHMAVPVRLNDAGPFRLIFDLGSPLVIISGNAAAKAGLISAEASERPALFGLRGQAKVDKLQIGELVVQDVPVVIMDHPTLRAASAILGPIEGIVGYPVFSRYRFAIDYSNSTISFAPGSYKPKDVLGEMMRQMFVPAGPTQVVASAALWGLEVDKEADDEQPGVVVKRVWPQGASEAAGLKPGDRLLTVDGRWTDSVVDALEAASFVTPGQATPIRIQRGKQVLELIVRPRLGL